LFILFVVHVPYIILYFFHILLLYFRRTLANGAESVHSSKSALAAAKLPRSSPLKMFSHLNPKSLNVDDPSDLMKLKEIFIHVLVTKASTFVVNGVLRART
jgi:hypothetical protein